MLTNPFSRGSSMTRTFRSCCWISLLRGCMGSSSCPRMNDFRVGYRKTGVGARGLMTGSPRLASLLELIEGAGTCRYPRKSGQSWISGRIFCGLVVLRNPLSVSTLWASEIADSMPLAALRPRICWSLRQSLLLRPPWKLGS